MPSDCEPKTAELTFSYSALIWPVWTPAGFLGGATTNFEILLEPPNQKRRVAQKARMRTGHCLIPGS